MIHEGRVYIDNTIMKSLAGCGLYGGLRHVAHIRGPHDSAPLRAGSALHETLATYFRMLCRGHDHQQAIDSSILFLEADYGEFSQAHVSPDDRLALANVRDVLLEWYARCGTELPFDVHSEEGIEIGFAHQLDDTGKYVFFGKIDLLATSHADGRWIIVDHKSTGRIDDKWRESWNLDPQSTGYYWAGLTHNPEVVGFQVNGIQLSKLPNSTKKCPDHGLPYNECRFAHAKFEFLGPYSRSVAQLERWRREALQLAKFYEWLVVEVGSHDLGRLVEHAPMTGPWSGSCRDCTFKQWCGAGCQPAMIPGMGFVVEKWYPWDPREMPVSPLVELVS